jgi:hypothetical protein
VTLRALNDAGLREDRVRWLVAQQLVQQFLETTQPGQAGRHRPEKVMPRHAPLIGDN